METLEQIPWKSQNELFEKLEEMSKLAVMNDSERAQYNEYLRQYRDNLAVREAAVLEGREQGIKQGIEQGIKQGVEQGIKQGIEQGIERVAFAMLSKGFDLASVSACIGLSMDDIRRLRSMDGNA